MIVVGMILLAVGGVGFLSRIVMGPSLADRVIAVDGLIVTIVAAIIVNSIRTENDWFLDVALVAAFVGFVGTTAGGRFIERRGG
jgi:multicomponent Na+:H+ antiporter subunit F